MSDAFIIFASGDPHPGDMVQRAIETANAARIIAADGGALIARDYGLTPERIIGDFDSLTQVQQDEFSAQGVVFDRYPAEKDETDLELVLMWVAEQKPSQVLIIGALGGRIDQTLANIYLLSLPVLAEIPVSVVDGNQRLGLLHAGKHTIDGQQGDTLSLLPLDGDVEHISTDGLYYPLKDDSLAFGPARGISNVFTREQVTIAFTSGLLLFVHTIGRA